MAGLPPEVRALVELSPVEDILLAVLEEGLPGINVQSLVEDDQSFPLVLARRLPHLGYWDGDERFLDSADIVVHTFAPEPDGDEDAALLAEAVRVVLRNAGRTKKKIPGRGHVNEVRMTSAPRRAPDWATSSGPVQYADLPTGVWRYETQFHMSIRKSRERPFPLTP